MEKYELNKFIEEYKKKINDLYFAFNIEKNKSEYDKLKEKMEASDFWNDQKNAQAVIAESNLIKQKLDSYNLANNRFNDILDLVELSEEDEQALEMLDDEIEDFKKVVSEIEQKALLSGKYDFNDCILELHPGAGGTESMDWALMLFRMYNRYCQRKGFKINVLDYQAGDEAGIKSVTMAIKGDYAYGQLKSERGVHRLVRISPFDSNARRHTSFCSCDVSPQIKEADDVIIKDDDIRVDTFLSSGHGGQGVNTTYSAVRITHLPTNIVVTCQNERSQLKNKDICLSVLKSKLLELELKKQESELKNIKGEQMAINFGSQIRSYVFTPYTMVKDHRTDFENFNVDAVMDGDLDGFIDAYLKFLASGKQC